MMSAMTRTSSTSLIIIFIIHLDSDDQDNLKVTQARIKATLPTYRRG